MNFKKTIKFDGKIKGLHIQNGVVLDSDDNEVNIVELLEKAYKQEYFDLSTTTKTEEEVSVDDLYD